MKEITDEVKTPKREITDDEALAAMHKKADNKVDRIATVFVPRTIVYPVVVKNSGGTETIETRTYVRMYEYTSPRRWAKAQEIEKKYKKLNEDYTKAMKAAGFAVTAKEKANPLNFSPLGRD